MASETTGSLAAWQGRKDLHWELPQQKTQTQGQLKSDFLLQTKSSTRMQSSQCLHQSRYCGWLIVPFTSACRPGVVIRFWISIKRRYSSWLDLVKATGMAGTIFLDTFFFFIYCLKIMTSAITNCVSVENISPLKFLDDKSFTAATQYFRKTSLTD